MPPELRQFADECSLVTQCGDDGGALVFDSHEGSRLMALNRRDVLKIGALAAFAGHPGPGTGAAEPDKRASPAGVADYTIRIGTGLVELARDRILATTTYNGQFPGPLIRLNEGARVVVDIHNDTDTPEQLHWHGLAVPVDADGASEEGTPFIPPHGMRRVAYTPKPAGFRFYHSHVIPMADLNKGTYSGRLVRCTSSQETSPVATIERSFSSSKNLSRR